MKNVSRYLGAVVLGSLVVCVCSCWPSILSIYYPDIVERGQFGDQYGAVNALFSGVAMAGVLVALMLQRSQFARQSFEHSFFQLLESHRSAITRLSATINGHEYTQSGVFSKFVEIMESRLVGAPDLERLNELEREVWTQDEVGFYFRQLYQILKFIREADVDEASQIRCARLLRAQLSGAEVIALSVHGLRARGQSKLKLLVECYAMLHDMPQTRIRDVVRSHYTPAAFGTERPSAPRTPTKAEGT